MQTFPLPESKMWFMRFSMDRNLSLLACGNAQGKVFLYNPHEVWKCGECVWGVGNVACSPVATPRERSFCPTRIRYGSVGNVKCVGNSPLLQLVFLCAWQISIADPQYPIIRLPPPGFWPMPAPLLLANALRAHPPRPLLPLLSHPASQPPLPSTQMQPLKAKSGAAVRQTAVSRDGTIVLASCEDGTIWRWDKVRREGGRTVRGGAVVHHQTAVSRDGTIVLASCEDGTIWRWDKVRSKGGRVRGQGLMVCGPPHKHPFFGPPILPMPLPSRFPLPSQLSVLSLRTFTSTPPRSVNPAYPSMKQVAGKGGSSGKNGGGGGSDTVAAPPPPPQAAKGTGAAARVKGVPSSSVVSEQGVPPPTVSNKGAGNSAGGKGGDAGAGAGRTAAVAAVSGAAQGGAVQSGAGGGRAATAAAAARVKSLGSGFGVGKKSGGGTGPSGAGQGGTGQGRAVQDGKGDGPLEITDDDNDVQITGEVGAPPSR